MGSSGDGSNTSIDASVGSLVWIRRRNGSWWPGRIMGLDELSENCLVSPRSGTPVKLLGREDASVDWYNLDKSKRVKPFRCGEYDECIEKAKASAANSSKKVVKYARREDAILHALELESARLGKEPLNFCSILEKSDGETDGSTRDSPHKFHFGDGKEDVAGDVSDSEKTSNSTPLFYGFRISSEEPNHNNSTKVSVSGRRRKTPNDSEDDGSEGVKRMRGLEDLGIGVVSKTKVHTGGTSEIGQQSVATPCTLNAGMSMANGTSLSGEVYPSTFKRKRSRVAKVHEFLKRKNRRRPLTKVLEINAMVSVPVICDELPGKSNAPLCGLSNGGGSPLVCNGSKKSGSAVSSYSSDGERATENEASLNVYEDGYELSNINHKTKENEALSAAQLAENCSADKLYDVPFVGVLDDGKHNAGFPPALVSCLSRKSQVDALGSQPCNSIQADAAGNEELNEFGFTNTVAVHVNNITLIGEKSTSKWQSKGKRKSRHTSKSRKQVSRRYADVDYEHKTPGAGSENLDELPQGGSVQMIDCNEIGACSVSPNCTTEKCKSVCKIQVDGFWDLRKQSRGTAIEMNDVSLTPQRSPPDRSSLFTVNSRYQMADFPGHNLCSGAALYDVKLEVKASYRPQHVPLVSLMSKLNGKAIVGHPLTIEVLADSFCDHLLSGSDFDLKVRPYEETPSKKLAPRSQCSTKKFEGKRSGLSFKKTRTLSSLTGRKLSDEDRKPVVDKLKRPGIACIPLKVVFSRINEAVNGLGRATHLV